MFQAESFAGFGIAHAPRETSFISIELGDQISSFIQDETRTLQNLLPDFCTGQPSFCKILSCHRSGLYHRDHHACT